MANRPKIYLAGPDVFRRDGAQVGEQLKAVLEEEGLEGVFPLDIELSGTDRPGPGLGLAISRSNEGLIRECDAVLANLTPFRGPSADVGTVYEIGYARALGKLIFGYSREEMPFEERTRAWAVGLGIGLTRRADGSWEDGTGYQIEGFGLHDNLMIDGAIHASGGKIFAGGEDVVSRAARELATACR